MFEVVIEERAEFEFYDAIKYYENLNVLGLAERFYKDYTHVIKLLESNPYFELKTEVYRGVSFENFPFMAFYIIYEDEKVVKIVSIFHTSLNPTKYPK